MRIAEFLDAVAGGDELAVRRALRTDAALADAKTDTGVSALLWALYNGQPGIARLLAAERTALAPVELAALGDTGGLAERVTLEPEAVRTWSADGFTPLHLAAFFGHSDAVRILLEAGAPGDIVASHPAGMAPIHSAAASRSADAVAQLIAAGVNVNAVQAGGFTALMSAALHGLDAMADCLLEAGAQLDITSDDGLTAAEYAARGGHARLAARLAAKRESHQQGAL